jgi:hypothetical protein
MTGLVRAVPGCGAGCSSCLFRCALTLATRDRLLRELPGADDPVAALEALADAEAAWLRVRPLDAVVPGYPAASASRHAVH